MGLLKNQNNPEAEMSFLEHLEALRWHLMRSAVVVVALAIGFFIYREFLFDQVLLAPKMPQFWTYRQFCKLSHFLNLGDALCFGKNTFELINTELSGQFTMHMWASMVAGLVCGAPYVFWELWQFIKPALKNSEKNAATGTVFYASFLFLLGILFGYYIIVPLSVNFLGTYQVSNEVKNMIQMESFISTVTTITLASGIVFELPVVVYFLTKIGIMGPAFMRTYRKHAVVVILILAAVITPSPDVTSQLLVALPLYLLYEISIFISGYVQGKEERTL